MHLIGLTTNIRSDVSAQFWITVSHYLLSIACFLFDVYLIGINCQIFFMSFFFQIIWFYISKFVNFFQFFTIFLKFFAICIKYFCKQKNIFDIIGTYLLEHNWVKCCKTDLDIIILFNRKKLIKKFTSEKNCFLKNGGWKKWTT